MCNVYVCRLVWCSEKVYSVIMCVVMCVVLCGGIVIVCQVELLCVSVYSVV